MEDVATEGGDRVRTAEVIAALSLATDLGTGVPLEHGLHSTLIAMRLAERLGVDQETASHTYYACLLFYVGCTAGAETAARIFGDEHALTRYAGPVRFGSRGEMMAGVARAIAPPGEALPLRAIRLVNGLPRAARAFKHETTAFCQVAQMLTDRLGLPSSIKPLFAHFAGRWDGKGEPTGVRGEEIPLEVRILHVARDAAFQRALGGHDHAVQAIRDRAGRAFDPIIARLLVREAQDVLALADDVSAWDAVLGAEPGDKLILDGDDVDTALEAVSNFADLTSRYLVGHSAGVAGLASVAADKCNFQPPDITRVRRAAFVHDIGRVAVPVRIWNKEGPLTPDEWERVRLHAYQSERVLAHSPFLRNSRRSRRSITSGSTARAITAARSARHSVRWRGCWPLLTRTTP